MILDFVLPFLHWKKEMYVEAAAKENLSAVFKAEKNEFQVQNKDKRLE